MYVPIGILHIRIEAVVAPYITEEADRIVERTPENVEGILGRVVTDILEIVSTRLKQVTEY